VPKHKYYGGVQGHGVKIPLSRYLVLIADVWSVSHCQHFTCRKASAVLIGIGTG